jgi:hypothetical protein
LDLRWGGVLKPISIQYPAVGITAVVDPPAAIW